jgi:hypothetical protein
VWRLDINRITGRASFARRPEGLAGCGTYASFTEINSPPHEMSSRPPSRIQVFSSGPPSRPYVDVAVIRVEQTHSLNEQSAELMIRRIREQAGAIGCDAVVLGGITDHNGAQPGTALYLLDPGSTKQTATCIVYKDNEDVRSFRRERGRSRADDADGDPATPVHAGQVMQQEDAEDP